ncbi:YoaK family protein [Clostridium sp. MSJ-8]|uniref:YoaK family protein n=1 Tax=Clostridium sp. MSJ-8 TaxID=2841510 RepID=UPI0020A12486|nr:YoaK family protein [Clostridium sp. MSJ-8]
MINKVKHDEILHFNMALIGGILGAYAILNWCDVLGSAQTSNMIHLMMDIVGGNIPGIIIRLGSVVIYIIGLISTVIIKNYTKINVHIYSVIVDAITVIMVGIMPKNLDVIIALYPIFFAMAVQWNSFPGVHGYNSSTIFSTNNLKQTTIAITEYICNKEKDKLHKAKFYGKVLLSFHLGVAIAFICTNLFGMKGVWIGIVPTITALELTLFETESTSKVIISSEDNSIKKVV